jgi:hypothetical protein
MTTSARNANSSKSWISSLFSPTNTAKEQQFGVNLTTNNKAFSSEISNVSKKFVSTNKKYRDEIAKYKKIVEFNKQLTSAYITNFKVMVDVSKLLTDYSAFFHVLKEEVAKTEGQIGTLQASEVQHIEDMTKDKLGEFSNIFMDQSEKVKALYTKYGQEEQIKGINNAQESMKIVMENASNTLRQVLPPAEKKGGRKPLKARSRKI